MFIFNSLPALDKDEAEIFLINCHPPLIVTKMPHLVDRLVVALSVVGGAVRWGRVLALAGVGSVWNRPDWADGCKYLALAGVGSVRNRPYLVGGSRYWL